MARLLVFMGVTSAWLLAQPPIQSPATDKAWQILRNGASDKSTEDRVVATRSLGLLKDDPAGREMAEKALTEGNTEVKVAGAQALGEMGATESIPALKEALKANDTDVVAAAADALYKLEDPAAYNVYYAVLSGKKKTGKSLSEEQMKMIKTPRVLLKQGIAHGLGFVPVAGTGVQAYKVATRDEVTPVRAAAAARLSRDPDPKSGDVLVTATHDEKWLVRAASARAIAKRDDPALLPAVERLLNDHNDRVKYTAAGAVIRLSGMQERPGAPTESGGTR